MKPGAMMRAGSSERVTYIQYVHPADEPYKDHKPYRVSDTFRSACDHERIVALERENRHILDRLDALIDEVQQLRSLHGGEEPSRKAPKKVITQN